MVLLTDNWTYTLSTLGMVQVLLVVKVMAAVTASVIYGLKNGEREGRVRGIHSLVP